MSLTSIHNTLDEDLPIPSSPDCPVMSSAPVIFAGVVISKKLPFVGQDHRQQILFLMDGLSADTGCSLHCFIFKVAPDRRELFAREMNL